MSVVVLCMIPEAYNVITNGDRVPSCHPNLLLEVSTLESHAMKLVCFWQMKPGPQGMLGSVVLCLQRTGAGRHVLWRDASALYFFNRNRILDQRPFYAKRTESCVRVTLSSANESSA